MGSLKLTNNDDEKPSVQLSGEDGNVFSIMARVKTAMDEFTKEFPEYENKKIFTQYQDKVFGGSYEEALRTTMEYCEVH